jgi:hypothetical protein
MTRRRILECGVSLACIALVPAAANSADDRPRLSGSWTKKGADPKVEFDDEDTLTILPHGDGEDAEVECSYTVTKAGLVKAKVVRLGGRQELIEKLKVLVPVGLEFQFNWRVNGDAATLDSLKGKDVAHMKGHLEGEYAKEV